jgi:hypothetical protein
MEATSGLSALRTALKTYTGHGDEPATLTNEEMIVSSEAEAEREQCTSEHGRQHQRKRDLSEPTPRRSVEVGGGLLERSSRCRRAVRER